MKKRKTLRKFILASALLSFTAAGFSCDKKEEDQVVEKIKVSSINFNLESQSVYIGLETFIQNVKVLPENASNHKLSWSVKDPDIAEIINDKVVGKKAGKTKIIAKATDESNVSKELDFEVRELAAPSAWEVKNTYSFYFEKSFTPEIKFYPNFPYVNKACTYEVIDGQDVLKVENGVISAYKKGTGQIKITSVGNPSLSTTISCIADDDLLCKYEYFTYVEGTDLELYGSKDERVSVLDFRSDVKPGNWPTAYLKLDKPRNAMSTKISIDSKLVSGKGWYSLRLARIEGNTPIFVGGDISTGTSIGGVEPVKNKWTTSTFDYSDVIGEYDYIVLCIDADKNEISGVEKAEMLFDNIRFEEFVDHVDSMNIEDTAFVGVNGELEIKPTFTPSNCSDRRVNYTIKEGADVVEISDNKIKGLKLGTAVVEVQSVLNPLLKKDITITVTDDLLCGATLLEGSVNSNLKVHNNKDGRNLVLDFSAEIGNGSWPVAVLKLSEVKNAMSTKILIDAKLVSGPAWYSVRLFKKQGNQMVQVGRDESTGTEATAVAPVKDAWTTSTFDFSDNISEYEYIYICLNADSNSNSTKDSTTEILFNNIRFAEFVDRVDSIDVQETSLVGVGNTLEIKAKISPENCSDRRLSYSVKSGEEFIDIVEGKIHGKKVGTGVVKVTSVLNHQISKDVTIIVTDDLLVCSPVAETTAVNVKYLPNVDGRNAVTSISHASTSEEAWYMLIVDLKKSVPANTLTLTFDAKYVSGKKWYSINLCGTLNPFNEKEGEVGYGTTYNNTDWYTETYHSSNTKNVRYLAMCINSKKESLEQEACFMFSNLKIVENN